MTRKTLAQQMYGTTGPSRAPRITLAILLGVCVAVAWWLLLAGGTSTVSILLGRHWQEGELGRRGALAAAFAIYFVRVLFTEFVFLRRGVSWTEAFTIAPWVFCIYILLAAAGGTNASPLGTVFAAGVIFFLAGSWMNSYAEYQRHAWKLRPENRGKLYTLGLFSATRHPNYLGDLISFSGLCLLAGRWFTGIIPLLMLCGFVFVNVPALDTHLAEHYGAAFDDYARRTRKLIPFLY